MATSPSATATSTASLPDAELDGFVDALAQRIASFDKQAIAETKHLVDIASLPSDAEIAPEWDAFIAALQRPAAKARIKKLMERGFHQPGDGSRSLIQKSVQPRGASASETIPHQLLQLGKQSNTSSRSHSASA